MNKNESSLFSKRLKDIEINLAYLIKEIQTLKEEKSIDIHYHYTIDWSNYFKHLNDFLDKLNIGEDYE